MVHLRGILSLSPVVFCFFLNGFAQSAPQSEAEVDINAFLDTLYGTTETTSTTVVTSTTGPTSTTSTSVKDSNKLCDCVGYFQCKPEDIDNNSPASQKPSSSSSSTSSTSSSPSSSSSSVSSSSGGSTTGSPDTDAYGVGVINIKLGDRIDGDDSCHYLQVCCKHDKSIPADNATLGRPPPDTKLLETCGNYNPNGVFKITGNVDNEALYGELPWMVAVLRRDNIGGDVNIEAMECGGSIIHPQVVITAAHCVNKKSNLFIRAGEWDTRTEYEQYPNQDRNVKQVIIHKDFFAGAVLNDVALLVLESPLVFTEVVQSICLPAQDESMDGMTCTVSGWGKDDFGKESKYQVILKKVDQKIVPRDECQAKLQKTVLGSKFKLHKSFLCAGGQVGKGDSCKGDGGGPLACPSKSNPKQYVLGGLVAWGIGCGTEVPSVYVDVSHFRNWIDDQMNSLTLRTNYDGKA